MCCVWSHSSSAGLSWHSVWEVEVGDHGRYTSSTPTLSHALPTHRGFADYLHRWGSANTGKYKISATNSFVPSAHELTIYGSPVSQRGIAETMADTGTDINMSWLQACTNESLMLPAPRPFAELSE